MIGDKESRAHALVARAKKDGLLDPQPCEVCGATEGIEAHHDDYGRPLLVRWLCKSDHAKLHIRQRQARQPRRPERVKVSVTLAANHAKAFRLMAEESGRSLSSEMRLAIRDHLDRSGAAS